MPDRRTGRQIYLTTCVSCHSRDVPAEPLAWRPEAVSFPPGNYEEENEPPEFEMHEDPPHLVDPTPQVLLGAEIYQESCATCHAEDGTGRNWIGSFLDPPPPNLNQPTPLTPSEREALVGAVRDGIVGTAMPAWRHVLDKSQIDAVVAYIEAAFRRPAP